MVQLKIMQHHLKCARCDFEDQEEINKEKEQGNYFDYPHDPEARTLCDRTYMVFVVVKCMLENLKLFVG